MPRLAANSTALLRRYAVHDGRASRKTNNSIVITSSRIIPAHTCAAGTSAPRSIASRRAAVRISPDFTLMGFDPAHSIAFLMEMLGRGSPFQFQQTLAGRMERRGLLRKIEPHITVLAVGKKLEPGTEATPISFVIQCANSTSPRVAKGRNVQHHKIRAFGPRVAEARLIEVAEQHVA